MWYGGNYEFCVRKQKYEEIWTIIIINQAKKKNLLNWVKMGFIKFESKQNL